MNKGALEKRGGDCVAILQAWFSHRINSFHGILFRLNHLILRCVHMSLSDLPENSSEPRTKHVHKNMELR